MCQRLRNFRNMVVAKVTKTLTLVRANKSRGGGHWSDDDYDVREGSRVDDNGGEAKPSTANHGYAASRKQAMTDFKAR